MPVRDVLHSCEFRAERRCCLPCVRWDVTVSRWIVAPPPFRGAAAACARRGASLWLALAARRTTFTLAPRARSFRLTTSTRAFTSAMEPFLRYGWASFPLRGGFFLEGGFGEGSKGNLVSASVHDWVPRSPSITAIRSSHLPHRVMAWPWSAPLWRPRSAAGALTQSRRRRTKRRRLQHPETEARSNRAPWMAGAVSRISKISMTPKKNQGKKRFLSLKKKKDWSMLPELCMEDKM